MRRPSSSRLQQRDLLICPASRVNQGPACGLVAPRGEGLGKIELQLPDCK